MQQLVLNIVDNRLNTLDYVSVETTISDYQMEEVGARLQMLNDGEMKIRPWEDGKEYIFR
jgi:hypothetical protein